jgi:hypothetical protein
VLSFPECSADNTHSLGNRRFAVGYSTTTFGGLGIFDSGKRSADKTSSNENPRRKISAVPLVGVAPLVGAAAPRCGSTIRSWFPAGGKSPEDHESAVEGGEEENGRARGWG